jgi:sugar/nucleoside kinase (ribokinase family)
MSILCVGQYVADIVVRPVSRMPARGTAAPVEEIALLSGGCAANTAAVLAKLGADARLAALLGTDALGDAAVADLRNAGVNVEPVRRDPETPTSAAVVLVNRAGGRSFFYRSGGNEMLSNDHIADDALRAARIVHVGGGLKLVRLDLALLMRRAKSFGAATSLDTDWDIFGNWMERLRDTLPLIDYLMTNEEEAAMLTGKQGPREAAAELLAAGPKAVVIKRGARGALLMTRESAADFPAYAVKVRDTTCAGDAFSGGFLFGISRGLPLDESVRLGNAAGALSTTEISHRGVTSLEAVRRLIEGERP